MLLTLLFLRPDKFKKTGENFIVFFIMYLLMNFLKGGHNGILLGNDGILRSDTVLEGHALCSIKMSNDVQLLIKNCRDVIKNLKSFIRFVLVINYGESD